MWECNGEVGRSVITKSNIPFLLFFSTPVSDNEGSAVDKHLYNS